MSKPFEIDAVCYDGCEWTGRVWTDFSDDCERYEPLCPNCERPLATTVATYRRVMKTELV